MTGIRRLNAYDLPVTPGAMGPWREKGACVGAPQAWFFPERGESAKPALDLCAKCPVIVECRKWALSVPEKEGIWGGMTGRQRRGKYAPVCRRCGDDFVRMSREFVCASCRVVLAKESKHRNSLERTA